MAVLEQVQQMKSQGIDEGQIIGKLQQQGISSGEIQNALNQYQVKEAVSGEPMDNIPAPENEGNYAPQQGYQDSYGAQEIPQEGYAPQQNYEQPMQQQENYTNQEYAPQQGYQDSYGGGTDNTIEVAEQVFSEKIKKTSKKVNDLVEFKTLTETKINNFEDRLKRIESMIDQMQIKILEKIGNYGKDLSKAKKEISMVQDSFGKMVNKIADKAPRKKVSKKKVSKK